MSQLRCPYCSALAELLFTTLPIYRCSACALEFRSPQPDDPTLGVLYAQIYHANFESKYTSDELNDQIYENGFKKLISEKADFKGLDFGCGGGKLVNLLRAKGIAFYGVDGFLSPQAKSPYLASSLKELETRIGNDSGWDLIVLNEVIEHLRAPWLTVEELYRALRPGGHLFIKTPNIGCLRRRLLKDRYEAYLEPTHLFFFCKKSLLGMIEKQTGGRAYRIPSRIVFNGRNPIVRVLHAVLQGSGMDGGLWVVVQK